MSALALRLLRLPPHSKVSLSVSHTALQEFMNLHMAILSWQWNFNVKTSWNFPLKMAENEEGDNQNYEYWSRFVVSWVIFAFVSGNKRKSDEEPDVSEIAPKRVSTPSVSCFPFYSETVYQTKNDSQCRFIRKKFSSGAARSAGSKGPVERRHFGEVRVQVTAEFISLIQLLYAW